jgi:hypothetical protein
MRALRLLALLFIAAAAAAQQRPLYDPSDFVNPRLHRRPGILSRLIVGGVLNFVDDYRPAGQDFGVVHLANSFYWSDFQVAYKHTELRGGNGTIAVRQCGCPDTRIFFPTPPPADATPDAPPPGSKDTVQFSWYHVATNSRPDTPIMLRYRATIMRQSIDTVIMAAQTDEVRSRLSGREQSFGIDADTYLSVAGHDLFGSVVFARTKQSGTIDPRAQNELTYTNRFRTVALRRVLMLPAVTIGGVSNRGGTAVNVVNPRFEFFWHHEATDVNVHVIYSLQFTNSGLEGWKTTHQIALFADRALFVKLFH